MNNRSITAAIIAACCWWCCCSSLSRAAASPTNKAATARSSTHTYTKASFVPPAAPSLTKAGWSSAANHPSRVQRQIITGYGTYYYAPTSPLFGRKKINESSSSTTKTAAVPPVTKNGKVQIKLLVTVPNLGQSGDILFVSSAVFQNQLQKSKKARLISADEVALIEAEKRKEEEETKAKAIQTKKMMEEKMLPSFSGECSTDEDILCGVLLTMKRKAGAEGNLFGGINPKMIMDELATTFPDGNWEGKQVKLTDIKDSDGNEVKKKDIKQTGDYTCVVKLGSEVDVTFILSVVAE